MKTYIVLLRGINGSGQKKIKMSDLKNHLHDIALDDVSTYIQSGNLIIRSNKNDKELKPHIEKKIQDVYHFHVPVKILSKEILEQIINDNPYTQKEIDTKFLYIGYLYNHPDLTKVNAIKDYKYNNDEFIIKGDIVYIYCPGGAGNTKLNNNFFEKKPEVTATTRNWKTTLKLLELSGK